MTRPCVCALEDHDVLEGALHPRQLALHQEALAPGGGRASRSPRHRSPCEPLHRHERPGPTAPPPVFTSDRCQATRPRRCSARWTRAGWNAAFSTGMRDDTGCSRRTRRCRAPQSPAPARCGSRCGSPPAPPRPTRRCSGEKWWKWPCRIVAPGRTRRLAQRVVDMLGIARLVGAPEVDDQMRAGKFHAVTTRRSNPWPRSPRLQSSGLRSGATPRPSPVG